MDASTVYRKTDKGIEELETRKYGLSMALRRGLILVDGNSDVAKIMEKGVGIPDVEGCLKQLEQAGYIRAGAGSSAGTSPAVGSDVKQRLIEAVREVLGPKDSEKVVAKIERAPATRDGLEETLNMCKKLVKLTIDEKKAKILETRCREILQGL